MKILNVNAGQPRLLEFLGRQVQTSIVKSPVTGPVRVGSLNIEGDAQADLSVHGGRSKAVYMYPHEYYAYWQEQLGRELTAGMFGENLTTLGLSEESICLGDRLGIGSAEFAVTQPRTPCFKLQFRFQREDMTKRFFAGRRFGFYLSVLQEGELEAGDEIRLLEPDVNRVSVADAVRLFTGDLRDAEVVDRALRVSTLPTRWQEEFRMRRAGW